MIIDTTAAARRADDQRVGEWQADQRVFISSALADTGAERRAVAETISELSATPVWFDEFGRDGDAEEAYLTEVNTSTIYVGILNEIYGRPNPPDGDSATEIEYRRARSNGIRVNVYTAAEAPGREGALNRFIDRVRFFTTTENYSDAADLARRVRRRLEQLASEALSPWIKLGDYVFRADEIVDQGPTISVRARVSDEIAYQLESMRDNRFGNRRIRFVSRNRVVDAELGGVRRTTRAVGAEELEIELQRVSAPQGDAMRAGTSGLSADELVHVGLRHLFLGENLPEQIGILGFMSDTGISVDDLRQAFDLSNEFAEAVVRLVTADGLVGSARATRVRRTSRRSGVGGRPGIQQCCTTALHGRWDMAAAMTTRRPKSCSRYQRPALSRGAIAFRGNDERTPARPVARVVGDKALPCKPTERARDRACRFAAEAPCCASLM